MKPTPGHKPGTWRIRVEVSANSSDGKKRSEHQETFVGSFKAAQRRTREIENERDRGKYIGKNRETLGDYVDHWLYKVKLGNVRPTTWKGYFWKCDYLHKSGLTDRPLQEITTGDVQSVVADLLGRGLSQMNVKHFVAVTRNLLNDAVDLQKIAVNPVLKVVLPAEDHEIKSVNDEDEGGEYIEIWDKETVREFRRLLREDPVPYSEAFELVLYTGLRRSEVCGLRWSMVDLAEGVLKVRRGRHDDQGTPEGAYTAAPKSRAGRRDIELSPTCVRLLERIKEIQNLNRMEIPGVWPNDGYVISKREGTTIRVGYLSEVFKKFIRKHGLPDEMTFHKLRHVHGTMLNEDGWGYADMAERLGHSSVTLTMNVYTHIRRGVNTDKLRRLDDALDFDEA